MTVPAPWRGRFAPIDDAAGGRRMSDNGRIMNLVEAIEAFNQHGRPRIELTVLADGRTIARLPRLGKEILVKGTPANPKLRLSSQDIALLCEEAQLAIAPGMTLLEAALAAMGRVARDDEDVTA